eukprot:NODE_3783_length_1986_cov_8.706832.p1 GENE.NODE_3783_length_1986_cov_8.706832~~NODE_3783_length_1986_cov_8.706832.p1  ORF type:complete len:346 (+),score=58.41 NODE_3783_length_1986_cov_8.706832:177-1214(+)
MPPRPRPMPAPGARREGRAGRARASVLVLATFCLCRAAVLAQGNAKADFGAAPQQILAKAADIHPMTIAKVPISRGDTNSFEAAGFGEELAAIVRRQYAKYVAEIMPAELKDDTAFRDEFVTGVQNWKNAAFTRWQRRAFGKYSEIRDQDLTPRYIRSELRKDVDYAWPEFHESAAYRRLEKVLWRTGKHFLERATVDKIDPVKKPKVFIWAEMFGPGEGVPTYAYTNGALAMGRYVASGAARVDFFDPRGPFPPFGKVEAIELAAGDAVLFPIWAPHAVQAVQVVQVQSVSSESESEHGLVVCLCFQFIGEEPQDWEDDPTGDPIFVRDVHVAVGPDGILTGLV